MPFQFLILHAISFYILVQSKVITSLFDCQKKYRLIPRLFNNLTNVKNSSYNLQTFNRLLSKGRTMNGDFTEEDIPSGGDGDEEVVMNVDTLENKDYIYVNKNCSLDMNSTDKNATFSKTLKSQNSMEFSQQLQMKSPAMNFNLQSKPPAWSTSANFSDLICLGATVLIVTLLISVLIFYVFKDHEKDL